jgi:hypothetical protein
MGTLQQEPQAAQPPPLAAAPPGRQEQQQPPQHQQEEVAQRHQQAKQAKKAAKRAAKAAEQEQLRLGLDPAAAERPLGRCHYFLHKKGAGRFCSFQAVAGARFCGHHLHEVEGSGQGRVPCPWDPKGGHTVLESELDKHKLRCPSYRLWLAERSQPCFAEDINAGRGPEAVWPPGLQPLAPPPEAAAEAEPDGAATGAAAAKQRRRATRRARAAAGPSALPAAYAASLGEARFAELLRRVEAACAALCEPEPLSLAVPPAAEPFLLPESATCNRPFSLKHAQQQASIVGNMQQRGLVPEGAGAGGVTFVEYGAGKGYLRWVGEQVAGVWLWRAVCGCQVAVGCG